MNIAGLIPTERRIHVENLVIIESIEVSLGPLEEKQLEALIRHVMTDIQTRIIRSYREPKSGRVYKYRGRDHRASAPGQAPAIRSGKLLESTIRGISFPSNTEAQLAIDTGYETFLEVGTFKMQRRPYVFPAIDEVLAQLKQSDVIERFETVSRADIAA